MKSTQSQLLTQFKTNAEENQLIPRKFSLSEIKIINSETIDIKGSFLVLERKAFRDIITILGMTEKVLKVFDDNFTSSKTVQVLNLIQENISRSGINIVLYANPKNKTISRIVAENKRTRGLSLETYFNTLDRILNSNSNLEIKGYVADHSQTQIDLIDHTAEFRVGDLNIETFHPGLSFGTTFNNETFIENFTERLVCTNGMVYRDAETSYALNENFKADQWQQFFDHIDKIKKDNWVSPKFSNRVIDAMKTPASLSEMINVANLVKKHAGKDTELWVPLNETTDKFKNIDVDYKELNERQLSTAKTGTSVWTLINGLTDFASHDYKFEISDLERLQLQIQAGKILMKPTFDIQNIVTKSPF